MERCSSFERFWQGRNLGKWARSVCSLNAFLLFLLDGRCGIWMCEMQCVIGNHTQSKRSWRIWMHVPRAVWACRHYLGTLHSCRISVSPEWTRWKPVIQTIMKWIKIFPLQKVQKQRSSSGKILISEWGRREKCRGWSMLLHRGLCPWGTAGQEWAFFWLGANELACQQNAVKHDRKSQE